MSYAKIYWQGFFYKYTRLLCHFYLQKKNKVTGIVNVGQVVKIIPTKFCDV